MELTLSSGTQIKKLSRQYRDLGKEVLIGCVVTTRDDRALVSTERHTWGIEYSIPEILWRRGKQAKSAIVEDGFLAGVLGRSYPPLSESADIAYLGGYRFTPPRGKQLYVPYAVELEKDESSDVPTACDRYEWRNFDDIEEDIEGSTPLTLNDQNARLALRRYFDAMTYIETEEIRASQLAS